MEPPGNWSAADKKQFLISLNKHGDTNLEKLQNDLPTKTAIEIRQMITYYKKKAMVKWLITPNNMPDELKTWINILSKLNPQDGVIEGIVPRALKYIAMFEKNCSSSDISMR